MNTLTALDFELPELRAHLCDLDSAALDALDFGVIGIDNSADAVVCEYNSCESRYAGLSKARVLGHPLFTVVAPCMNNFMVAQRFEDSAAEGTALDVTLGYVLTLRMRPVKVRLRLLATPGDTRRWVLVERKP